MTRRALMAAMAGGASLLRAAPLLHPLDEQMFRQVVASHRGSVLLADFWATWCAPCKEEFPKLVALHASMKSQGLALVTISCDEPEQEPQALAFAQRNNAPGPLYIRRAKDDDHFINAIDPKWSGALPVLFLFDRSGRQVASFIGETDMQVLGRKLREVLRASS